MSSDLLGTDGNEVFNGDDTLVTTDAPEDYVAYTDDGTTATTDEEALDDSGDYDYLDWFDDGSDSDLAGTDQDVPTDELVEDESYDPYVLDWSDGWANFGASPDQISDQTSTLQLGAGIQASDLHLEADGNDLMITIEGQDGEIVIGNFLAQNDYTDPSNPLQQIVFDDGTVWDINAILQAMTYPEVSFPEEPDWATIDPIFTPISLDDWLVLVSNGQEPIDETVYYTCVIEEITQEVPTLEVVGSSGTENVDFIHRC